MTVRLKPSWFQDELSLRREAGAVSAPVITASSLCLSDMFSSYRNPYLSSIGLNLFSNSKRSFSSSRIVSGCTTFNTVFLTLPAKSHYCRLRFPDLCD